MALGITSQKTSRGGQRAMVPDGGEHIAEFTLASCGIAHAIGREYRKLEPAGDFDGRSIPRFLGAMEVPLQFHGNIPVAKDFSELLYATARFLHAAIGQGHRQRTFFAAAE